MPGWRGIRIEARAKVASPIGTLMKKIQCQLTAWVSTPPTSNPIEPPAEATKAYTLMAVTRWRGSGKRVTRMLSTIAAITAAPAP